MTNEFVVQATEILLLDESDFFAQGGEDIHFGRLDGAVVSLFATGSVNSINHLAHVIAAHHTSATRTSGERGRRP